jgi:hypothetical protein
MTNVARCDKTNRDQKRPAVWSLLGAALLRILSAATSFFGGSKRRQQFHAATVVTVMPPWETNKGNILIGELRAAVWLTMVGWSTPPLHESGEVLAHGSFRVGAQVAGLWEARASARRSSS